jgi:hypothetical protein
MGELPNSLKINVRTPLAPSDIQLHSLYNTIYVGKWHLYLPHKSLPLSQSGSVALRDSVADVNR